MNGTPLWNPLVWAGALLTLGLGSGIAAAQSTLDNIRPVARVCLSGQPCVGSPATPQAVPMASMQAVSATRAAEEEDSGPAAPEPGESTVTPTEPAPPEPQLTRPSTQASQPAAPEPEPTLQLAATESDFDPAASYQRYCLACHGAGVAGAPRPGDTAVWEQRLAKGMDGVMANVINGLNAMPPRGICMSCSDQELQSIVDYMVTQ